MAKTYIYCIILGILLLLFINSCNNANVDNNYFKGDITEVNDLATSSDEVVLNVLELNGNNYGWPAVHDSLIIFFNPKLGEHFYQVFNIDTGNEIGHYCKRGNGPYEYSALGPIHQLFTENGDLKTLLFAPNESKIITWNITKSISNKTTVIEKEYDYLWRKENAQICYDQIFRLNEDTILAELRSGLTYNGEISLPKYQKRTLLSNKLVEEYTAYKKVIDNDESIIIPEAYEVAEHSAYVGVQDYILNSGSELTATEAELYFKTNTTDDIAPLQAMLQKEIGERYPHATVTFSPPENIFEKLFVTAEADLVAQLHETRKNDAVDVEGLRMLERDIAARSGHTTNSIAFRNQLELMIDQEKLLLYNVSYDNVIRSLRTAFKENQVSVLRSYQQYLPISIAGKEQSVNSVLTETLVPTAPNEQGEVGYIPLHQLVTTTVGEDLKDITAGKNGEYIPLGYYDVDDVPALMESIEKVVDEDKEWDVDFSGSYFSNEQMMGELVVILLVSVLLMYFILCAQFESFVQPLIVLVEIPIDTAFALITLWVCGHTLNLMSAIGIIVTCGIVVNDSILKIDSINELRKAGMPMYEAIHTAGKRRLRAIIMTSLTTILAMVPLLFTSDMGSELQKPLAIAMIGSMVVGTLVSLFVVPLAYYMVEKLKIKS